MLEKGIVLAGGLGTRLRPLTSFYSKQLLPVYDKPMIYYPISTLMNAGIRDICIIVDGAQKHSFQQVLGDGAQWGINLKFLTQESPDGIPQAYVIAQDFIEEKPSCLILGDNLLVGSGLGRKLKELQIIDSAKIFLYEVEDPTQYGNVSIGSENKITKLVEKPEVILSRYAVPGIYFLDGTASERAKGLTKSKRGEYEIVDLLNCYLEEEKLEHEILSRGTAWLDTGTVEDLFSASEFIRIIQRRQGQFIGSPEEIALRNKWIGISELKANNLFQSKSVYGAYLRKLTEMGAS